VAMLSNVETAELETWNLKLESSEAL